MKGTRVCTLAALALLAGCAFASAAHTKAPVQSKDMERLLDSFFKDVMQSVAAESSLPAGKRRSLQTVTDRFQNVQAFFEDMLGGGWRGLVPARWANSSFDWGKLGDFEYGSSLADFLSSHDLKNISSVNDLAHTIEEVEAAFCEPESFTSSEKVPAACTGPTVSIALMPKVCVLESKDKQIVCDPAKLVLTKSPGSCVHKYKSASSWVGKECKHSGGIGFSDEMTIGGGEKTIPLIDIDIGYQAK